VIEVGVVAQGRDEFLVSLKVLDSNFPKKLMILLLNLGKCIVWAKAHFLPTGTVVPPRASATLQAMPRLLFTWFGQNLQWGRIPWRSTKRR
jgi:hypothetical protein